MRARSLVFSLSMALLLPALAAAQGQDDPVVDAGPDVNLCGGGSAVIGGNPTASNGKEPFTYSWTPPDGLSDPTVANPTAAPAQTTVYTVTVTTDNGKTGTDQVIVYAGESDSDSDAAPDCVEFEEGTDPLIRDNDVFANARLFARQQYRDFLGREGDEAGIQFWTDQIESGAQSRAQMIEAFFNSAEFQQTSAPVMRLYFAFFLRIPDSGGLLFWQDQARQGVPLRQIAETFAASDEFATRYGALTDPEFVDLVYENVLGRPADAQGRQYWIDRLESGEDTRGSMMLTFSESAEHQEKIATRVFVVQIYLAMLGRAPDEDGFFFWVGVLDDGAQTRQDMIGAFLGSDEYHDRFLF